MELFKVALSSLKSNKLRSALTILGIVVGIFSIISTSTVIRMLQNSIESGVSQLGKNTFQIQKWDVVVGGGHEARSRYRNRRDISIEEYYRLREVLKDAQYIGAEQWTFARTFSYGSKKTNPNVMFCGCTPEALPNNQWYVESGREFNYNDVEHYQNYALIGIDIANALFEYEDPIGKEIKVDNHKLKVIGLLEKQGGLFGMSRDNFVLMPITAFQNFYGRRSRSINITVSSFDQASYDDTIEKAVGAMRLIRKVKPGEQNDFGIFSNQSILEQIDGITSGVRVGAIVIAAIALLAAGIGIMNIMLVSVTERTKEIGLRKSVGAKKSNILNQFIIEAVSLCILGGVFGILLGLAAGNFAGSFLNAAAAFPMDWISIGVGLCILIGVSFGTYPAYKAANLDPIEALRYD